MRRALLASVAVLSIVGASPPAEAQLGRIARNTTEMVDDIGDMLEALKEILKSLVVGLPETVVQAPGGYIDRLQAELALAAWYSPEAWDRYVTEHYPATYLDTWQGRAEWTLAKSAATAEQMAREAVISAGISSQQPLTALKLEAIALLNKTPLGTLFAEQLAVENGLIHSQLLSELSSQMMLDHQRDTEDRLEDAYRQMQARQLPAARNGGMVPDTATARWATVTVGQSVTSGAPAMIEIPTAVGN